MELWAAETRLFWSAALAELGGVGQTLCTAAPGREAAGRAWQLGAGPIALPVYLEMFLWVWAKRTSCAHPKMPHSGHGLWMPFKCPAFSFNAALVDSLTNEQRDRGDREW